MTKPNNMAALKREKLLSLLETGTVLVGINPDHDGVQIPDITKDPHGLVYLNYSYRFHVTDFEVGEECVVATLSFKSLLGIPAFKTVVPYGAISVMRGPHAVVAEFKVSLDDGAAGETESVAIQKWPFRVVECNPEIEPQTSRAVLTVVGKGEKDV